MQEDGPRLAGITLVDDRQDLPQQGLPVQFKSHNRSFIAAFSSSSTMAKTKSASQKAKPAKAKPTTAKKGAKPQASSPANILSALSLLHARGDTAPSRNKVFKLSKYSSEKTFKNNLSKL